MHFSQLFARGRQKFVIWSVFFFKKNENNNFIIRFFFLSTNAWFCHQKWDLRAVISTAEFIIVTVHQKSIDVKQCHFFRLIRWFLTIFILASHTFPRSWNAFDCPFSLFFFCQFQVVYNFTIVYFMTFHLKLYWISLTAFFLAKSFRHGLMNLTEFEIILIKFHHFLLVENSFFSELLSSFFCGNFRAYSEAKQRKRWIYNGEMRIESH